jgi:hypothetical protein
VSSSSGKVSSVRVAVRPAAEWARHTRLFNMLSELLPVEFCPERCGDARATINLGVSAPDALVQQTVSTLHVAMVNTIRCSGQIRFASGSDVPRPFRSAEVPDPSVVEFAPVPPRASAMVQASIDERPVWTRIRAGHAIHDAIGVAPRHCKAPDLLRDHFHAESWFPLLPVLDFLRAITADIAWEQSRLRATFMFDDPNLHSSKYGYLEFKRIAEQARLANYHVAIATVPIDAWYTNSSAVSVFDQNPEHLSILLHGNNHLSNELGRDYTEGQCLGLLAQALRRIESMESRTGLMVSRVMAPPHGACREIVLRSMQALGFEAACMSDGSLRKGNSHRDWPLAFGSNIAEFCDGFPIIPRTGFTKTISTKVRLAAFLGRPIIPTAHHLDCADGLETFNDLAALINSFGPVCWADMKDIARSNFQVRRSNGHLSVRSFARRIDVPIEPGIHTITVQPAWTEESCSIICRHGGAVLYECNGAIGIPENARPGNVLEISFPPSRLIAPSEVPLPRPKLWPLVRRSLCIARDRVQPLTKAAARRLPPR